MDVQVDVAAIGALSSKKEERPCRADQVRLVLEIYTLTQINLLEEIFQPLSHNPARLSKNKRPTSGPSGKVLPRGQIILPFACEMRYYTVPRHMRIHTYKLTNLSSLG